jgi:hypothetical protein
MNITTETAKVISLEILGRTWMVKARRRQRSVGTFAAARQLRKQGVGLSTALLLLTGRVV